MESSALSRSLSYTLPIFESQPRTTKLQPGPVYPSQQSNFISFKWLQDRECEKSHSWVFFNLLQDMVSGAACLMHAILKLQFLKDCPG